MFDPKTLKVGDVVEFLSSHQRATLRGVVGQQPMSDAMDRKTLFIQPLDQNGNKVNSPNWGDRLVQLDRILGLVEGGPLPIKDRMDWDRYFMQIATEVSSRATCDRKHVGAVIVKDRTILSTGYNGSIRGAESCRDRGHMMEDGHCVRTVHAEANAIIQAAKNGSAIDKATLYTTASPCWWCFKLIANAGIERVVFGEMYRDNRIFAMGIRCGIEIEIEVLQDGKCVKCGGDPEDRHDHT